MLADVPGGDVAYTSVVGAPSATQASRLTPAARGVVVADLFGGVVFIVLR